MRRLSFFALLFVVLACLYWLLEGSAGKKSATEPVDLISGFDPAAIERVTISDPQSETIMLQRSGTGWKVATNDTGYAADTATVQALLTSLADMKTGTVVSRNSKRHALYDLSPETALRVETLDTSGTTADVMIGKNGPNIFSTYVRIADSDAVYLVDGILKGKVSKTLKEWRDKTVFDLAPDTITGYTVTGEGVLNLHKSAQGWHVGEAAVSTEAVEQSLRTFATLSAVDLGDGPLDELGLARPVKTVTAKLKDGSRMTLLMGKDKNAFQQYAKTADSDTVYVIEKHILGMLCPSMEDLNTPAAEEEAPTE